MNPTSAAQFASSSDGSVPALEQVCDRVWSLAVPMPQAQRGLAYNLATLLVDDEGRVHVVDPGWDSDANFGLVLEAVERVSDRGVIGSLIVTHLHQDHLGLAERLRTETAAPIVMHEREASALRRPTPVSAATISGWGIPEDRLHEFESLIAGAADSPVVEPNVVLRGSRDILNIPGLPVEAIHTPGHTQGSICLRLPDQRIILTGDHVLPNVSPGIGLGGESPTNPIRDYLVSLDRVSCYDDHEVLPGHGYRFRGLRSRAAALAAHHGRRTAEVSAVLETDPHASTWQIASSLRWTAGWPNMHGYFLHSALLQTAMHSDLLRAGSMLD